MIRPFQSVFPLAFTLMLAMVPNAIQAEDVASADSPRMMPPLTATVSQDSTGLTDDIDKAEALVRQNPNDPEAHFMLGIAYSRTPYLEKALTELVRARKLAKKTKEGYALFDRKIAEYEKMLASDPDNPKLLYRLGFGYYFRGYGVENNYIQDKTTSPEAFYAKAEQTFRRLVAVDPDDAIARDYLGYFLVEQGEHNIPEAVALWEETLKRHPEDPGAHMLLGQYYLKQGDLPKAVEYSTKALQYRNDWLKARNISVSD